MPMKCVLNVVTVLVVLLTACAAPPTEPSPAAVDEDPADGADVAAIEQLLRDWNLAVNAGDVDSLVASFTNDAIRMSANMPAQVGREAIRAALEARFNANKLEVANVAEEIRVTGDWAFVRGRNTVTQTPKAGGKPTEDTGKWLIIVQRQSDSSWKWHRDIGNSDNPAPTQ